MINNEVIQNCTKPFSAIKGLLNEHALGKILIKNVYQSWQGESIESIKHAHDTNPYSLRIGMPSQDSELRGDSLYFILHYLSYNPLTKDIEKRELIPYRNMEKVYIGQSIDEKVYSDYRLFVDGNAVVGDVYLKNHESLKQDSLGDLLITVMSKIENLQFEIADLKRQLKSKHIYTQGTDNEQTNTVLSREHIKRS
jgi:hypothetical protein